MKVTISRSKVAAVTASLVFALSGGVAIADEAAATAQPTVEAAAQEQTATETQTTGAENATTSAATGGSAVGQAQDNGEASQQADEKEKTDDANPNEAAANDGQQADSAESKEATDAQTTASSGEATATADDVALEAQVADYYQRVYNRDTKTEEYKPIDESDIKWVPVDVSKYSSDRYFYVDEDGFRIFYYSHAGNNVPEGTAQNIAARVKIGENDEFLLPSKMLMLDTDHSSGPLMTSPGSNGLTSAFMDADVPRDAFTKALVDKYGETYYYYPGGEYGPAGKYYLVSEDSRATQYMPDRYIGMYWQHWSTGDDPFSGTSASSDDATPSPSTAFFAGYESGTATATPATGTAYVSPTAAETTPATSDATSLAGAAAAAISALGAFVGAKAIRRK